jgi:hypothetical protein
VPNNHYKAIPDPLPDLNSLRETALATKEAVEVLTRQRQPVLAGAVTWQDLVDLKLISLGKVPTR